MQDKKGFPYPYWTPFEVNEVKRHLGLYVFNGLFPSPRVEMKFQSQRSDPVNGNDFVYHSFGKNAERRHRMFKDFFTVQDPRIAPPRNRTDKPIFKVDPFLDHMKEVFPKAWLLGKNNAVDEQTIGFQGHHVDKLRITYKAEGDGFQCDALCDDGFTFSFYFRSHPAPKKYLDQGLSPLHARVMSLFDASKDSFHRVGLDNLYMSAKFAKAAFNHKNKVLVAGVTRKGMRGLPQCVIQEEQQTKSAQMAVRGTVKAAVLMGDPDCPDLIAASVYDTKPVHFLSKKVSGYRAGGDGGKCLKMLKVVVGNVADNPSEDKYKRVGLESKAYKAKIKPFIGAKQLLLAIGFQQNEEGDALVLKADADAHVLSETKSKLEAAVVAFGIPKYKSFGKAYLALPSFYIREMWLSGETSGLLWSIGNYFSLISVFYLGEGVGYPLVQTSILVSGLWGILYFKEVTGTERVTKWFLSSLLTFTVETKCTRHLQ